MPALLAPPCKCGCGEPCKPHPANRKREGWVKGVTFFAYAARGHSSTGRLPSAERAARVAECQRLVWDEGLDRYEVARRMGLSKLTVDDYMADPTGEKQRAGAAAFRERRIREDREAFLADARERNKRWRARKEGAARGATWIDGPRLLAWLAAREIHLTENQQRTALRWRATGRARLDTVDRVLSHHGCHLSELPDDYYL